jgi:phosphatidylserine decarboxylase
MLLSKCKIILFTFILFILFLLYFYRSPKILSTFVDNAIYSPTFGTVLNIEEENLFYHISIFLSLTDPHYQYFPTSGIISNIIYDNTGKYNMAYNLNKSKENEKCIHFLETKYGQIIIYQIAGLFARRIKWFKKSKNHFKTGEKLGLILFGSRVDIKIPKKNFLLLIKKGQKVKGASTIIGIYK